MPTIIVVYCECSSVALTIQKCWRGFLGRKKFAAARAAKNKQLREVRGLSHTIRTRGCIRWHIACIQAAASSINVPITIVSITVQVQQVPDSACWPCHIAGLLPSASYYHTELLAGPFQVELGFMTSTSARRTQRQCWRPMQQSGQAWQQRLQEALHHQQQQAEQEAKQRLEMQGDYACKT